MKRLACIVILLLVEASLFAAGIPIAIMDIEPIAIPRTQTQLVSELLRVEFVKTPLFNVVERNDLVKVLSEQELQLSGLTDAGEAVRVGELVNVKKILLGSMAKFEGKYIQYVLNIRIVDVETGSVEMAESIDISDDDAIRDACYQVTLLVSENTGIIGEIALIEDESIYTTLGSDVGVQEGDNLEVFDVHLVKDKQGRILLREENIIAQLKVISTDTGGSKCNIIWKKKDPAEGMSIRRRTGRMGEEPVQESGITFISIPPGAKAYINGDLVGITPVVLDNFDPGKYSVEMRYPGHRSYTGKINLIEGRQITVERELEKLVEVEDMMEQGKIPRKTTDPHDALLRSLLPGGGQFYNKYEVTGLGISLLTFINLAGTGTYTLSYLDDLDEKNEGNYDEYYGYVLDYKLTGSLLKTGIIGGFAACVYGASMIESVQAASTPFKYTEYTEIKFGAMGLYTTSSQYPDAFTGGPGDYQNPVLDAETDDISALNPGAVISAGVRSRNFETIVEFGFSNELSIIGFYGRLKFPVLKSLYLSLGCANIINLNEAQDVEYSTDTPVSFFRDVTSPTVGISYESPSLLFILDGSPVAFGSSDFFYTSSPTDIWTQNLYLQAMMGLYIRTRIDYYFNARFGISAEARYIHFYGMIDNIAADAGLPVFEYHNTLFVTIAPVFRF